MDAEDEQAEFPTQEIKLEGLTEELPRIDVASDVGVSADSVPGNPVSDGHTTAFAAVDPAPTHAGAIFVKGTGGHPPLSTKERKRRRNRRIVLANVALIACIALALLGMRFYTSHMVGKILPDCVGMTEADASTALSELGFTYEAVYELADDDIGRVIAQNPIPGVTMTTSQPVSLTITQARVVPDVVDSTEDEARLALDGQGATNVLVRYRGSSLPEGTVLDVSPSAGSIFRADDEIVLTVAEMYTVPDVVGMAQDDAVDELEDSGYEAKVVYVDSDFSMRSVVSQDPAGSSKASHGTVVTLNVSSPYPSDPYSIADYFSCSSADLSEFLEQNGFALRYGTVAYGHAETCYALNSFGTIIISERPDFYYYAEDMAQGQAIDALAQGGSVLGVRFDFTQANSPSSLSMSLDSAIALAQACGIFGDFAYCDQDSIVLPQGYALASSKEFMCISGSSGGYVWCVTLIDEGSGPSAIVVYAEMSCYADMDLSGFDDSYLNLLAYYTVFTY